MEGCIQTCTPLSTVRRRGDSMKQKILASSFLNLLQCDSSHRIHKLGRNTPGVFDPLTEYPGRSNHTVAVMQSIWGFGLGLDAMVVLECATQLPCDCFLWYVHKMKSSQVVFSLFLPTDNCRSSSALLSSRNQCLNWSSSNHSTCTCSVLCSNKTLTGPEKHIGKCLHTHTWY